MKLQTSTLTKDIKRWAKAYKAHTVALSYSKNTTKLYDRAIGKFIEYAAIHEDEMSIKDIRSIFITGFLAFLEEQAEEQGMVPKYGSYLSKSTKDTYMKAIKSFFTFISDNNDELFTFERYFKNIKIADSSRAEEKIKYLTVEEEKRLLEVIDNEKDRKESYNSYRNALLIKLLLYAGLRISEALGVRLSSFEPTGEEGIHSIKITGKGNKEQKANISYGLIDEEIEYFKANIGTNELIMVALNGKPWLRNNAYDTIARMYKKAGINKKGLHILRHTLAMRLTEKKVPLTTIKKILRHSNIATTTIYSKASDKSAAEALRGLRENT